MKTDKKQLHRMLALFTAAALLLSGCTATSSKEIKTEYIEQGEATGSEYKTTSSYRGDFELSFSIDTKKDYYFGTELYWKYGEDKQGAMEVKKGDTVSKGDVLASFEVTVSEADLLEKELTVSQKEAAKTQISTDYERRISDKQTSMSALSGNDYQAAAYELAALQAEYSAALTDADNQLEAAKEALSKLQSRKDTTTISAPFDGVVIETLQGFRQGNAVDPSKPVVVIAPTGSELIAFENTSPYGMVPYGLTVEMTDMTDQKVYEGTVICCKAVSGQEKDLVVVLPSEEVPEQALSGAIRITGVLIRKSNVVLLESAAIKQEGSSYYVQVLGENGAVNKSYVSVGGQSGSVSWITEGLDADVTVVLK